MKWKRLRFMVIKEQKKSFVLCSSFALITSLPASQLFEIAASDTISASITALDLNAEFSQHFG